MPLGFLGTLTIVFIVLKLTEVVAWSWFWVLSPLLLGIPGVFLILVILSVIALLFGKSS